MSLLKDMPLNDALGGGAAEIVTPRQETSFAQSIVKSVADMFAPNSIKVGQPLSEVTGNDGEMHTRQNSAFATTFGAAMALGGLFKLMDSLSTPPPTQEQIRQDQIKQDALLAQSLAQEDQRKANSAKEELRKQQSFKR